MARQPTPPRVRQPKGAVTLPADATRVARPAVNPAMAQVADLSVIQRAMAGAANLIPQRTLNDEANALLNRAFHQHRDNPNHPFWRRPRATQHGNPHGNGTENAKPSPLRMFTREDFAKPLPWSLIADTMTGRKRPPATTPTRSPR